MAALGSTAYGGYGDDRIYGQGLGDDTLHGGMGDDTIFGGQGVDIIWGDDMTADNGVNLGYGGDNFPGYYHEDASRMWGDDSLYGGEGDDDIYGGAGDDLLFGDEGVDGLYGGSGEDVLYGGDGSDSLWTGSGWDVVFGGDGCDVIYSQDGGDVIWAGACDPTANGEINSLQYISVYGTGEDPENYTVIMDFWIDEAVSYNRLCLYPDINQMIPGAGVCADFTHIDDEFSCLTATDILSGRAPAADNHDPLRTRGGGCKNDSGPLWVTV